MHAVSEAALALGSDSSLAGVSAAGAADAINELAKGGLTLDQAMQAARGTIQLATAGQLDFGRAAEITSNTLAQFSLQASDASRVGDVLAAASVASTAGVEDLAQALNYAGPSAAGLKISLEDTTTALALLAQGGVKGSEAGTQLRGMLVSLAAPSKQAAGALKELGVNAFDSKGNFVGLETLSGQLATAQGRLSDEAFQSATAIAFGRESMGAAIQLAKGGPAAFNAMGSAVREQGAAAKLAGANTQGLGGALESLQGDIETTGIRVYEFIKGPLEGLVRGASDAVGGLNDALAGSFKIDLDTSFSRTLQQAVDTGTGLLENFQQVAENVSTGVNNALVGLRDAAASVAGPAGLGAAVSAFQLFGDAVGVASTLLGPLGSLVGGIAGAFAGLPGPLQAALIGFLALKIVPGLLTGMNQAVSKIPIVGGQASTALSNMGSRISAIPGQVNGAAAGLRNFGQQIGVQQSLARLGGQEIGKFGGTVAALATRFPATTSALSGIAGAFRGINDPARQAASGMGSVAGAFTRIGGGAAGVAAGALKGVSLAAGGIVSALGGPFGIAITGAIVLLSLWSTANQNAKRDAEQHKADIDALAQSFNDVTGAASKATKEIAAQQLTSVKLKDGVTDLGTALTQAGISTTDWTAAVTGNIPKQVEIAARLDAATKSSILNSDAWKRNGAALTSAGVDIDLATAAANGNVDAQNKLTSVTEKLANQGGRLGNSIRGAKDQILEAGGATGELASRFGEAIGKFNDAQKQFDTTKQAVQDFGTALSGLQTLGIFDAIKSGAASTKELATALTGAGASARQTALDIGQAAAEATGSLGTGAQKASESMQGLRDQFIKAATDAGISQQAAEQLANQYGLIPALVATQILTPGLTDAQVQLKQLQLTFQATPDAKSVTIQMLSADAQAKLKALGFDIEQLPDGTFKVTPKTDEAKRQLDTFIADASKNNVDVPVNAQTAPFKEKLDVARQDARTNIPVVPIDGDPAPFQGKADVAKQNAQAAPARIPIDGDPALVLGKISTAVVIAGASTGVLSLDGNPQLVNGKIQQAVTFADGSKGTVVLDGNPDPATGKINGVVTDANGRKSRISVDANVAPANSAISGLIQRWNGFTISGTAVVSSRVGGLAAGGIVNERGVQAYARGGLDEWNGKKLRKMRGGLASVVPSRSYRVIGDNTKVKESYIPWNKSRRSLDILGITARQFGYSLQKMTAFADGGIAVRRASSLVSSMRTGSSGINVAELVAQLQLIRSDLANAQRTINVYQTAHNPVAEKASDTLVKRMRTLGQMGAFG